MNSIKRRRRRKRRGKRGRSEELEDKRRIDSLCLDVLHRGNITGQNIILFFLIFYLNT